MNDTTQLTADPTFEDHPPEAKFRWWLLIPLFLSVAAFVVAHSAMEAQLGHSGQDSPAVGQTAPQMDLVSLSDDLQLSPLRQIPAGKVTLVHFWGTWCGPCKMEYPHLSEMVAHLGGQEQFLFVPVSCERGAEETLEGLWSKTRDYFESSGIEDMTAFADPQGVTRRSVAARLDRQYLFYPTSILIDHQGKIAGVWEGYTSEAVNQIRAVTDRLIADCQESM